MCAVYVHLVANPGITWGDLVKLFLLFSVMISPDLRKLLVKNNAQESLFSFSRVMNACACVPNADFSASACEHVRLTGVLLLLSSNKQISCLSVSPPPSLEYPSSVSLSSLSSLLDYIFFLWEKTSVPRVADADCLRTPACSFQMWSYLIKERPVVICIPSLLRLNISSLSWLASLSGLILQRGEVFH